MRYGYNRVRDGIITLGVRERESNGIIDAEGRSTFQKILISLRRKNRGMNLSHFQSD